MIMDVGRRSYKPSVLSQRADGSCTTNEPTQNMERLEDCERLVDETVQKLDGLDIIASNAVCHPSYIHRAPVCSLTVGRDGRNSRPSVIYSL